MEESRRPSRLLHILIALLASAAGAAAVLVAEAPPGNNYGALVVGSDARTGLLGSAAVMAIVVIWALARLSVSSRARRAEAASPAVPAEPGAEAEVDVPAYQSPWAPAPGNGAGFVPAAPASSKPVEAPPAKVAAEPPAVLHRLRGQGWYVADRVHLSRIDIDHVAVGPAGVLAVQVTSTDETDPSGLALTRARVAAEQFQRLLLTKELEIEVVPAMLVWGDRLDPMQGGVLVVDAVAVLSGNQATEWLAELSGKELLETAKVLAVRDVLADLVLGGISDVPAEQPALQPATTSA